MSVQWFPGHMAKARRLIEEEIHQIDITIELVDARIPESSSNPMLNGILGKRKRIIVFNKSDLADPNRTHYWLETFSAKGIPAISVHSNMSSLKLVSLLAERINLTFNHDVASRKIKNDHLIKTRAMIVGIPNVGKSTLINKMIGKASANTGNKPGLTKGKQWLKLSSEIELLDTPGLLWPKIEDDEVGYRLAITGAVSDDVFILEEATYRLITHLKKIYPKAIEERYGLTQIEIDNLDAYELMLKIGRLRGALLKGDHVDVQKTSHMILKDFRTGKLGRISLE